MSRRASERLHNGIQNPNTSQRMVQWNGGLLPITYDDVFKICEQRGVGPSLADRIVEWNDGVLPETHEDAVKICRLVRSEFERRLAPGVRYIVVEGVLRRTKGVGEQPGSSKKTTPTLRRVPARLDLRKTYKRSTSAWQTPKTNLESKCPAPPPKPFPASKPEPLQQPSRQSIPWPTSPSMRGSLNLSITCPTSPSMRGSPVLSPGVVLLPISLHDEGSVAHVLDEFDAAASDVMSGYTNLTGASSRILHAIRNLGGEEEGQEEEAKVKEEDVWNPLEEIDLRIVALREAEAKAAAARNREERIREMVRQPRERQSNLGRSWGKRRGG